MPKFFTRIVDEDTLHSFEVEVDYNFSRGYRGRCDKYGAKEEPDEPPTIDLTKVYSDGKDILPDLSDDVIDKLEEEAWDRVEFYGEDN